MTAEPRQNFRRHVVALGVVGGLLGTGLLGGCVLPSNETASPIESIPADLFPTTVPSSSTTDPEPEETAFELALYWHLNTPDGARRVQEVIRRRESPATLEEALALLIAGPNEAEQAEFADRGSITPVAPDTLAPTIALDGTLARVTTSDAAGLRANEALLLPVAEELVCTLTGFAGVDGVTISDSQGQLPLIDFRSEPILGSEAATREDYVCRLPDPLPADGQTQDE